MCAAFFEKGEHLHAAMLKRNQKVCVSVMYRSDLKMLYRKNI